MTADPPTTAMTESERILNDAFVRWSQQFATLGALRRMFDLGLAHATEAISDEHMTFVTDIFTNPAHAELFIDQARARELMPPDQMARQMTEATAKNAVTSVRATNLVFGHTMLDALVFDCCRAATWVAPNDCLPYVERRKVDLQSVVGESADVLVHRALETFLEQLEKESLLEKVDFTYARCKPDKGFSAVNDYAFDRERLERLDRLRHETVHTVGIKAAASFTDEDDEFLRKTGHHLMVMVARTFNLKFSPEHLQAKMAEGL